MTVTVDLSLALHVRAPGRFAACVAAAGPAERESIQATDSTGVPLRLDELRIDGSRVHVIDAQAGDVEVAYRAEVDSARSVAGAALTEEQELVFRRPSRYCPSDRMAGLAAAEFGSLEPRDAVGEVEKWLHDTLTYVPGATDSDDDALHPLLTRTGVCRDFAHLGISMCRALGIPARYVAVYAPGLDPMEVHAVFEAAVEGTWYVFDGTRLAPRQSLVRMATGRDAADTALLTSLGGLTDSFSAHLTVTTSGDLPVDDRSGLVALA